MSQPNSIISDILRDVAVTLSNREDVVGMMATAVEQAIARRFIDDRNDIAYAELLACSQKGNQLRVPFSELRLCEEMRPMLVEDDVVNELLARGIATFHGSQGYGLMFGIVLPASPE